MKRRKDERMEKGKKRRKDEKGKTMSNEDTGGIVGI